MLLIALMAGLNFCLTRLYFFRLFDHEMEVGEKEAGSQSAESAALILHHFT